METQQKAVTELLEIMNKGNYFNKLKPNNDSFSATLNVSCYNELNTSPSIVDNSETSHLWINRFLMKYSLVKTYAWTLF